MQTNHPHFYIGSVGEFIFLDDIEIYIYIYIYIVMNKFTDQKN
jgi:hypothetical protein